MTRNYSSKPTSPFCFFTQSNDSLSQSFNIYRNPRQSKTLIISVASDKSDTAKIFCHSVHEGSDVVNDVDSIRIPIDNCYIDSIYSYFNSRYLLLVRGVNADEIREITFNPKDENSNDTDSTIFKTPKPVVSVSRPNHKISFFFPTLSGDSYESIYYAVNNQLFQFNLTSLSTKDKKVSPESEKRFINCAARIDENVFAMGVESNLLLYDSRQTEKIIDCPIHIGDTSVVSINPLDNNILYTGGYDGIVKQLDLRQIKESNKILPLYEVFTGPSSFPQCPVVCIAPSPIDKSVFAAAASGNILKGYVNIFKNGVSKYSSKNCDSVLNQPPKKQNDFITAATENKVTWISWSSYDPSLLISEDIRYKFRAHYFDEMDFDGLLNDTSVFLK